VPANFKHDRFAFIFSGRHWFNGVINDVMTAAMTSVTAAAAEMTSMWFADTSHHHYRHRDDDDDDQ